MNNKDLNYFLNLPWDFEAEKASEGGYYSRVKGIPCHSYGDTLEEAILNIKEALELYIEGSLEEDLPIIEPETIEKCTGRLSIRTTKSMHCKLVKISEEEGVSVSHLINDALVKKYG